MRRFAPVLVLIQILAFYHQPAIRAQDLAGLGICIDPGKDAREAFAEPREFQLNMDVARHLESYLILAHADTVILTCTDSSQSLSLPMREDIANANGVDWFHSIHHNAADGKRSAPTLVTSNISARRSAQLVGETKAMSEIMGKHLGRAYRTSGYFVRSFESYYSDAEKVRSVGHLLNLQMPGEISLVTFYDQPVEEVRLRNPDYLRLEALALYQAFLQYYEADTLSFAQLSGFIVDAETKTPVNNATVQLSPLEWSSTTDLFNNGFYSFFELPPGRYQAKVAAAGYESQTDSVTVLANEFNFLDFTLYSILPPTIQSAQPANDETGFSPYGVINLDFSRTMNVRSVAAAIQIEPGFSYQLSWQNQDTRLRIDPKPVLQFNTTYRLTLGAAAKDMLNHPLDGNSDGLSGDPFELTFTTAPIDLSLPQILATQPVDQDTGVFIGDLIRIELNKPLHQQTLNDINIFLQGPNQRKIKTNLQTTVTPSGRCYLYLIPLESLSPRTRYTVSLQNALADSNGVNLEQNFLLRFTTQKAQLDFSLIDDFNNGLDNWQDLARSPKFGDFDLAATRWDSIAAGLRDSVMAAQLEYHLSAGGLLDFVLTGRTDHSRQLQPGDVVGTYLDGDSSLCRFRFYFSDQLNSLYTAPEVTIDWYGWRMISFRFDYDSLSIMKSEVGSFSSDLNLAGFQLVNDQEVTGNLLFDDFFIASTSTPQQAKTTIGNKPEKPILVQSYPNPFSDKLNQNGILISYQIPEELGVSQVNLSIFNTLGQLIRELVDQILSPGRYEVFWDVQDEIRQRLPAGVYFYRLQIGERVQTRRLIILD